MSINQFYYLDHLGISVNTDVCAKKLEGAHGIYAAPIADFISHMYHHNGEVNLTQYWMEVASLVRLGQDERQKELMS